MLEQVAYSSFGAPARGARELVLISPPITRNCLDDLSEDASGSLSALAVRVKPDTHRSGRAPRAAAIRYGFDFPPSGPAVYCRLGTAVSRSLQQQAKAVSLPKSTQIRF